MAMVGGVPVAPFEPLRVDVINIAQDLRRQCVLGRAVSNDASVVDDDDAIGDCARRA